MAMLDVVVWVTETKRQWEQETKDRRSLILCQCAPVRLWLLSWLGSAVPAGSMINNEVGLRASKYYSLRAIVQSQHPDVWQA
jgi:hypothetical protein